MKGEKKKINTFNNQTECCGFDETISDNLGARGKVVFGIVGFEWKHDLSSRWKTSEKQEIWIKVKIDNWSEKF